jgi:DNA-directed RNA polymerase subunit F
MEDVEELRKVLKIKILMLTEEQAKKVIDVLREYMCENGIGYNS